MAERFYARLRQMTALSEIVRNEIEDLNVEEDSGTWKTWNRLVELSDLLHDQLQDTAECFEEFYAQ